MTALSLEERAYAFVAAALGSLAIAAIRINAWTRRLIMPNEATEQLLAAPLPTLIGTLGLAVAEANEKMAALPSTHALVYTIDSAEIEIKVAVSLTKETEIKVGGGATLTAFSVNASYSRTYGFKEEASSVIKIHLAAKPPAVGGAG